MWLSGDIFVFSFGIRVVGKDSWKKTRSWKVRYEIGKIEVGKFGLRLESTNEIGKRLMKLESFE